MMASACRADPLQIMQHGLLDSPFGVPADAATESSAHSALARKAHTVWSSGHIQAPHREWRAAQCVLQGYKGIRRAVIILRGSDEPSWKGKH